MNLSLVPETHPLLSTKLEEFDFSNPPVDPVELVNSLTELMTKSGGIGISANQAGLPYRVFVMKTNPLIACFNPIIVDTGQETLLMQEGCLSFPGLGVQIRRPKNIKVRYTNPNGEVETRKFTGMTARVFLHEFDHMEGIDFLKRAPMLARQTALKKFQKQKQKQQKIQQYLKRMNHE